MKKRLFSLITSLFMVISLVGVLPAVTASALTYGDYTYSLLSDGTVIITKYNGYATSISIPSTIDGKTVTVIEDMAFSSCKSLKNISVDTDNNNYSSENGVLFNKTKTKLISYPIGNARTSYTIPNSVTSIGECAFYDCDSLKSITIPDSVTNIGEDAFSSCSNLTNITIPDSVTNFAHGAFKLCERLTDVTIENGVKSIGEAAFLDCDSLTSITIPNSVTTIGKFAFSGCSSLTNVTIPNSVTSIGELAFCGCRSLTNITIPNSVTSMGYGAFQSCTSLISVTIGSGVTRIENSAFYNCNSLKSVTISNSVKRIGEYAFEGCSSLTNITIPNSINSIGNYAFGYVFDIKEYKHIRISNLKINCCPGTAGEKYAKDNRIDYDLHTHSYISQVIMTATCTEKGVMTYSCECGDGYTEDIPASGHNYVTTVVTPTCTEKGYTIHKCSVCEDEYTDTYTNATGHNYVSTVVKPTYEAQGYTLHKCSVCGDEYKDNYTAKLVVPTVTGFKTAATTANAIKLTNNKVAGATGYVYYRASAGKWVKIGDSKTNTFTETKLKSGTSYRYAVKAYKTANGKNYYSASYPTLWTSTNPATVSFTVAGGVKKAVLKWSKTNGATGYKVYYKTSAKGKWVGLTTTKSLTYTKTGLVKGKTYWFTVKAYRTANGTTYNSTFVTKSVKVK